MKFGSFSKVLRNCVREALLALSELEARLSDPNDPILLRKVYLRFQKISHGKQLWIGRGVRINYSGNLVLGERCAIGAYARIANHALITIGDDFISAPGLTLDAGSHDPLTMKPGREPIKIGNRVWCGVNVTILSGVVVGDDVVLGAGAVVCDSIPAGNIAVGVPARVIRNIDRDPNTPLWSWAHRQKQ